MYGGLEHSVAFQPSLRGALIGRPNGVVQSVRVLPGEDYVTGAPHEVVITLLGSCIAACVRDPVTGFGGMNHFMLPNSPARGHEPDGAGRYGNLAMLNLITKVLDQGCSTRALEVKLFGGADLNAGSLMVGTENVKFALKFLKAHGITPAAVDVGGSHARRIVYQPSTGRVLRQLLNPHATSGEIPSDDCVGRTASRRVAS